MSGLPKLIHRYEILDRLGRGGMGELYLGRDPLLDRYVAIKVLRAGFEGDELRERFAREARSAARLTHVNIVTIYDVGEDAGQPYIAMEYVPGETLFHIIQRKKDVPLAAKLQYVDELCAGLAHAHKAGIVHRDIKPANLMISTEGLLKILDFGIARLGDSNMTQAGMVMGTLNYMSPEQITGQPIDHRSDIFAVGAVFYELISYQQAFPGGIDSGVLSRIMEGRFTPLERVTTRIDKALARIIDRALAKNPNDRFGDLTAMREELARTRQRMDPRLLDVEASIDATSETVVGGDQPVSTPQTPRPRASRDDIQRRRADELAAGLAQARDLFAAGKFEEAAGACERVLIMDPNHEEAIALIERARTAHEHELIQERLREARQELDRGDYARAREKVSLALSIDNSSHEARTLRSAIDQAERRHRIEDIVSRGRMALVSRDPNSAIAAAQEVLGIDPTDDGGLALKADAVAYIEEERRKAEHARRAKELIPQARSTFKRGEMEAALAMLQDFSPAHPDVSAVLQELRAEARAIRERERERQRRVAAELQQARAALDKDDLVAAVDAVARARALSPAQEEDVVAVDRAIDARRAEIAEAKRRAEEEARRKAEEEARRKAEEEARRKAEEEARRRAEAEAQRKAEEEAKRKAEEEARRKAAEAAAAEAARRAQEEARRKAAEEARRTAEEEARRKADEAARRKAEEDARRKAEEDARRKAEDEARRVAKEEARRKDEEEARRKADEDARRRAEDETRRKTQEEARRKADEEARRLAKEEARRRADEDGKAAQQATAAAAPAGAASSTEETILIRRSPLDDTVPAITPGGQRSSMMQLAAGIVLIVGLLGLGAWLMLRGGDAPSEPPAQQASEPATPTPGATPEPPATPPATPPPASAATGTLVIDAAPWAEIVEIVGASGRVTPPARHTPLALSLPEGEYKITLRNPNDPSPRVVTARVTASGASRAFAEFAPVDVDDYFRRSGS